MALPDLHDITARLGWALCLGSAVGFERQWHQKMAGLKTNALVTTGAAGFACRARAGRSSPGKSTVPRPPWAAERLRAWPP